MDNPEQKLNTSDQTAGSTPPQQEVYLENANIDSIHGYTVHVFQSTVNHIVTEEINLESSSAEFVDSHAFNAQNSNIGKAHAEVLTLEHGDAGVVYSDQLNASGNLGAVFANAVAMNQSQSGVIVTREMQGDHIQSVLLIAGKVIGPVETKLDLRNALLLGAVAGVCIGVVISLLRLLKRR
jgi:hypothetical protein